jgi:hypothetical protein
MSTPFRMKGPSGFKLKKSPAKNTKTASKAELKKVEKIKNKKVIGTEYFIGDTRTDSTTFNRMLYPEGKKKKN